MSMKTLFAFALLFLFGLLGAGLGAATPAAFPAPAPQDAWTPPQITEGTFLRFEDDEVFYRVQELAGSWALVLERDPENLKSITARELYDAPILWVNLAALRSYEIYVRR